MIKCRAARERFAAFCVATQHGNKAYARMGMSPNDLAARYRDHAADCVKIAHSSSDPANKLSLLDMARSWLRLADQAEKNGDTVLVYETPGTAAQ
jgi:hypothetical protein